MKQLMKIASMGALIILVSGCDSATTVNGTLGVKKLLNLKAGGKVVQLPAGNYATKAEIKNKSIKITTGNVAFTVKGVKTTRDAAGRTIFTSIAGSNGQDFSVTGAFEARQEKKAGGVTTESCVLISRTRTDCSASLNNENQSADLQLASLTPEMGEINDVQTMGFKRDHDNDRNDRNDRDDHGGGRFRDRDGDGHGNWEHRDGQRWVDRDGDGHGRWQDRPDRNDRHDRHDNWNRPSDPWRDRVDTSPNIPSTPVCRQVDNSVYGSRSVRVNQVTTFQKVRANIATTGGVTATFETPWASQGTRRESSPLSKCK